MFEDRVALQVSVVGPDFTSLIESIMQSDAPWQFFEEEDDLRNAALAWLLFGRIYENVVEHLSELFDILKTEFGIDIHFQRDRNGEIRGYGIVDHNRKIALEGSNVMKLSELIDFAQNQERKASPLDVYCDLFSMEVRKSGVDGTMSIDCATVQSIHARCRRVNRHGISVRPKEKGKMWQSG